MSKRNMRDTEESLGEMPMFIIEWQGNGGRGQAEEEQLELVVVPNKGFT